MGDLFGRGLLRASGVASDTLNLRGELPRGERKLPLDAVTTLVRARDTLLQSIDVSGNRLELEEMAKIGETMLSNFKSKIAGIHTDEYNLKADTTTLNIHKMRIRPEAFVLLAGAVRANTSLTSLNVSHNYMVEWAGHRRGKLIPVQLCGVQAMAKAISDSTRNVTCNLQYLNMCSNSLGSDGAAAISIILPNNALRTLNLRDNKLGDEGMAALEEGLAESSLTALDLSDLCDQSERYIGAREIFTKDGEADRATARREPCNGERSDRGDQWRRDKGARAGRLVRHCQAA